MPNRSRRSLGLLVAGLFLAAATVGVVSWLSTPDPHKSGGSAAGPGSKPTTAPATPAPPPPKNYVDLIRRRYPTLAATQPLAEPLDLREAAHLVIDEPVCLDSAGRLWITHPGAPRAEDVLEHLVDNEVQLTRDRVLFAHSGASGPSLVCRAASGECDLVDTGGRKSMGRVGDYRWHEAMSWGGKIVVPTTRGASVFVLGEQVREIASPLLADGKSPVQILADWRGLLAWAPADSQGKGGRALRFIDGKWSDPGPSANWPQSILHLAPMVDGSVLQMRASPDGKVALRFVALPDAKLSQKELAELNAHPAIGSMTLLDDHVQIAARLADRGVVFHIPKGVAIRNPGIDDPDYAVPAWIVLRPGRAPQLLQGRLPKLLDADPVQLDGFGSEWLALDDLRGGRYFDGVRFIPLLRRKERQFTQLAGIDYRGRWLLREVPDAAATQPSAGASLLIDPTLPDPNPRLAVWHIDVKDGLVGWDHDNWPVMKSGGAWALQKDGWVPIDERKTQIYTVAGQVPPSTRPATKPATSSTQPMLLMTDDGTCYFDGVEELHVYRPGGKEIRWPLPGLIVGEGEASLMQGLDGMLYLVNYPGRVIRLRPTPDARQPFLHDATFTRKIPNVPHPTRVWMDPAGRIVIAYEGSKLAVMFPGGRIPQLIREMMPPEEEDTAEAD